MGGDYMEAAFEEDEEKDEEDTDLSEAAAITAPSAKDPSEEVPYHTAEFDMTEFRLGITNFVNKHRLSRSAYVELRAVLYLLNPVHPEVAALPRRIDTIKKDFNKQLPLLKMRKRQLQLDPTKLPTRSKHTEDLYLFDMRDVFRRMLHSKTMMRRVHIGMAHIVDNPVEFWHSQAWAGSNRTTSGEFAMIHRNRHEAEPILTSDFVWYKSANGKSRLGRVMTVGKDFRRIAKARGADGEVTLFIGALATLLDTENLAPDLADDAYCATPSVTNGRAELFLVEGVEQVEIKESQLLFRKSRIFLDYYWGTSTPHRTLPDHKYYIRRILTLGKSSGIRKLALSHPHRGKLELIAHPRADLLQMLTPNLGRKVVSFPYTAFIDGFGVYRNMHRSITGKYLQFAFLDELERKRQINVFPLTLGPFGANWEDVVKSLMHLTKLEAGVEVILDDGTPVVVCAPCLCYIGDMPQQQANSGCKSQNAQHFCRHCLISSDERGNLGYNTIINGRYHFEMIQCRTEADSKAARERNEIFQELGLAKDQAPLQIITPALDLFRTRPPDAVHSEWKGIARQTILLLFEDILKPSFHDAFAREFAALPTPPDWPRNQNIKCYNGSYSIQEYGRASLINPIVLQKWLKDIHIKKRYMAAIDNLLESRADESGFRGVDFVVHCYDMIAKANAVFLGRRLHNYDRAYIHHLAIESRERYQDLLSFAVTAASKNIAAAQITLGNPSSRLSAALSCASSAEFEATPGPRFGEEELVPDTQLNLKGVEKEQERVKALVRKQSTPNVHTIIHFYDAVAQYASILNVITLQGEDRHW
ncbi:hypothetical protein EJ02DRAFT_428167 [Clathrospora elynae]|uniref:Uncharacterized protein n=1 Tax=Clathrospora elynae TaxID=706981 RepID=A0A6A5S803_9PLEO|nr:hypothetical protein EJ02DRAFT_428167 [Clathrospora elynae]